MIQYDYITKLRKDTGLRNVAFRLDSLAPGHWPSYLALPVQVASSHLGKAVLYMPPLLTTTRRALPVASKQGIASFPRR